MQRRPRPGHARLQPSPGDEGALARAALWSASYHRFFGARYGRELMPSGMRPLSCGQTADVLGQLAEDRPAIVRRCLSQMLASGYVPDEHNQGRFCTLAQEVVQKIEPRATKEEAVAHLRQVGLRDFAAAWAAAAKDQTDGNAPDAVSAAWAAAARAAIDAVRRREPIPRPTVMSFDGDIFTARKQVLVPRPFRTVATLTNPRNWTKLGVFWKGKMIPEWGPVNGDPRVKKGEVTEHFVVNWNTLLLQEFVVRLRVTQRTTDEMVRTDYSLMYEEDDQLLVDQGYGEVRRIPERPKWACYTGEKTLKFASAMLNLLAPGVMAMFLDGIVVAFNEMFGLKRPRRAAARR